MKTKKSSKLAAIITAVSLFFAMCCNSAFGQEQTTTLAPVTVTSDVTPAAVRSFDKSFGDAQDVQWYKAKRRYFVSFVGEGQPNTALIQRNGSMEYDLTYYQAGELPKDVREAVMVGYPRYSIGNAVRVNEGNKPQDFHKVTWLVNVTDKRDNTHVVKVEDGQIQETDKYEGLK